MAQLIKGSQEYKMAQCLSNEIIRCASCNRWNSNSIFDMTYNAIYSFLQNIKELDTFASQVAETIASKMNCFGNQVAYISDKQSWILACAAVENNIAIKY